MKKFAYPVAFRTSTLEQKERLVKELEKLGYTVEDIDQHDTIVNNRFGDIYRVTTYASPVVLDGRHLCESESEFLALAGMVEGDEFHVGEWLMCIKDVEMDCGRIDAKINSLYQCEVANCFTDEEGFKHHYFDKGKWRYKYFRKATKEEIISHFRKEGGVSPEKPAPYISGESHVHTLNGEPSCPNDTDGDGNCGNRFCVCTTQPSSVFHKPAEKKSVTIHTGETFTFSVGDEVRLIRGIHERAIAKIQGFNKSNGRVNVYIYGFGIDNVLDLNMRHVSKSAESPVFKVGDEVEVLHSNYKGQRGVISEMHKHDARIAFSNGGVLWFDYHDLKALTPNKKEPEFKVGDVVECLDDTTEKWTKEARISAGDELTVECTNIKNGVFLLRFEGKKYWHYAHLYRRVNKKEPFTVEGSGALKRALVTELSELGFELTDGVRVNVDREYGSENIGICSWDNKKRKVGFRCDKQDRHFILPQDYSAAKQAFIDFYTPEKPKEVRVKLGDKYDVTLTEKFVFYCGSRFPYCDVQSLLEHAKNTPSLHYKCKTIYDIGCESGVKGITHSDLQLILDTHSKYFGE